MKGRIPTAQNWDGPYLEKFSGDLWKTFNVDLDKEPGVVSLSAPLIRTESTEITGTVTAFLRTNADCEDRYWALAEGLQLHKTDSNTSPDPSLDWDTDALDSTPTDPLDFTLHGNDSRNDSGRNKLFVTRDTGDIAVLNDTGDNKWTGSWWVTKQGQPALKVGEQKHPIEYFPLRKITLVGDGNLIHTVSRPSDTQNDTVTFARLTLPLQYAAWHIFTTSTRAWVCCINKTGGNGAVVEWDGSSQTYNQIHEIPGILPLSGVSYGGTPIVLAPNGLIYEFDGLGFKGMVRNGHRVAFPVFQEPGNLMVSGNASSVSVTVQPRGMLVSEGGEVLFNVKQPRFSSERQWAGIWSLNPSTGRLYNKYSLSNNVGDTDNDTTYGHESVWDVGGLYGVLSNISKRTLVAGGQILTSGESTTESGIWLLEFPSSSQGYTNFGYFVTKYISSEDIRSFWDSLIVRHSQFKSDVNKIIVKARGVRPLVDSAGLPIVASTSMTGGAVSALKITWTSTTTFTITLGSATDALAVGDEVEILSGVNAGWHVHITEISGAHGALQTITVDEAVDTGSSSSSATFDRWKKLGTLGSADALEKAINIGIDSSFIQFKVVLRGFPNELNVQELIYTAKPSLKIQD